MTTNQLAYWTLQETKRSNLARETETNRHNVASLAETSRHNITGESETKRHNVASENLGMQQFNETARHNLAQEQLSAQNIQSQRDIAALRVQADKDIQSMRADLELTKQGREALAEWDRNKYSADMRLLGDALNAVSRAGSDIVRTLKKSGSSLASGVASAAAGAATAGKILKTPSLSDFNKYLDSLNALSGRMGAAIDANAVMDQVKSIKKSNELRATDWNWSMHPMNYDSPSGLQPDWRLKK